MRYPAGITFSAFDWKDSVGPKDQRRRRLDYAWKSIESNQFGVNEFMSWCKAEDRADDGATLGRGARGGGGIGEYCNHSGERIGRPAPAAWGGGALWDQAVCLGNEMDGPWQAGMCRRRFMRSGRLGRRS